MPAMRMLASSSRSRRISKVSGLRCALLALLLVVPCSARADRLTQSPDGPEHVKVYLSLEQALERAFSGADTLWTERWSPSAAGRGALETELGWRLPEPAFEFHRGRRGGRDLGVAMVTEEIGRFKPITFMVKVSARGRVESVQVMVYRESRGDGVRRKRFVKQFRGKEVDDPIRLNRDLVVLSGATMSSRALAAGVKRVLHLARARFGIAN